ncbi:hypothetical protein GA0074694_3685 [Micromonospora inyonensis]|uniref:Uncharacterized protein n=1 Tax=Micromonospora inyonensis TaxID=47866 RepID=A0A1C6S298_9ACTN|nr:hypothetical protein GA0074694_3685 [Micromonospora inyonensis]
MPVPAWQRLLERRDPPPWADVAQRATVGGAWAAYAGHAGRVGWLQGPPARQKAVTRVPCNQQTPSPGQATTDTIRPLTTMTLRGSLPASEAATTSRAAARTASSDASAGTSTRPRTLPLTCTG